MFSDPVNIASGRARADGVVEATAAIPTNASGGRHTLQLNGIDAQNKLVSISTALDVKSDGSSALGKAVLAVLVLALLGAVVLPATMRRRRDA